MDEYSTEQLEDLIRDYIKLNYGADFIGFLLVEKLNPGYRMSIGIPSYMFPTTLACDFDSDELFLDFIYKELRERNYMRIYFYKVNRTQYTQED